MAAAALAIAQRGGDMSHDARGKLTMAIAGVVLAGLPFLVNAQSTSTPQQPRTGTYASQQKTTASSAQSHLDRAGAVLNSIGANSVKGDARTQFAELKQHFADLERAWRSKGASGAPSSTHAGGHTAPTGGMTSGTPGATAAGTSGTPEQVGATGPTTRQTPERTGTMSKGSGGDAVVTHYNAIAAVLDRMNPSSTASSAGVEAATRQKLAEFRQHLDQFHAAAMSHSSGAAGSASAYPSATTEASGTVAAGTASPTPGAAQSSGHAQPTAVNDAAIARLTTQLDELLSGGRPANSTVGTSGAVATPGTICVERAKLEQLRIDLQALRNQPR
jgi:hypothetical protein